MAPKKDQSKGPATTVLGLSKMTPSLLDDLARRGFVSADCVRAPPTGETIAHPRADEVIVFRDLFTTSLWMPLGLLILCVQRGVLASFHFAVARVVNLALATRL